LAAKLLVVKEAGVSQYTVMTTSAESAPESTIDLGCRIAMRAAMMKVSSPI
jgi:hypothetical protein